MTPTFYIVLGFIIVLLAISLVWRFASRRSSIPCPSWLGWLVEFESPVVQSYNASSIIGQLGLQPGMRVLDAGCGPGRVTIPLARQVGLQGEVTAIDIQQRMLQRAQHKAQAAGLTNIRFLQLGVGEGKLESERYDRALLITVLGEIPDRQSALKEIFGTLKPGGILSVTEIMFDPHYQSRGTILKLAGPIGFQEKSFSGNRFAFTLNLEKPE